MNTEQWLNDDLNRRKEIGLYRYLPDYADFIDFCSNDYLGIAQSPSFSEIRKNILYDYKIDNPHGSTGSRLISGNSEIAFETEKFIASFHKVPASLVYSTGYTANLGLLSAIAGRGDTVLVDEYIHASLIDGVRLSNANRIRFKHNDLDDLTAKLNKCEGRCFVVTESIFSMDGDKALLNEIVSLCQKHKAYLIVDEAHAIGIYGEGGRGLVSEYGLEENIWARVVTYGKAMGTHGAAVLGSQMLIDYLINFSRSFIYSTALPPEAYASILASYTLVQTANAERAKLKELAEYFKKQAKVYNLSTIASESVIQGIKLNSNSEGKNLENTLGENGIACKAILSPTIPEGKERLRVSLHSYNMFDEVDFLIKTVTEA